MEYYYNDRKSASDLIYSGTSSYSSIITNQQSINYKSPTPPSLAPSYSTNNTIYYNAESPRTSSGDGYCQYAQLNMPTAWGR